MSSKFLQIQEKRGCGMIGKIQDKLSEKLREMFKSLSPKEESFFLNLDKKFRKFTKNIIRPIAFAITTFWVFGRIKERVSYDEIIYILLVVQVLMLRNVNRNLKEMFG